jgi:hypothetical protein
MNKASGISPILGVFGVGIGVAFLNYVEAF